MASRSTRGGVRARPVLGLALGSGALHGIAHIGILKALARHGLQVDVVCGTSAGALAGVLYAAGLDSPAIEARARDFDWHSASSMVFPWFGLMSNAALQDRVDSILRGRRIEQLTRRFAAVATDLRNGERVVLAQGPAGLAIGASAAIPVLFEPVTIGTRHLVDGGLVEPVPIRAARELGAEFVIAVDVAFRPDEEPPAGVVGVAFQMMHVMINALIDEQIPEADHAFRMHLHSVMAHLADPTQALISAGERAFEADWPVLRAKLAAAGIPVER